MSTDSGIWGWTNDIGRHGFTVTFSLGLFPEDVLRLYGAEPAQAQMLTRDQAWGQFSPESGGSQLRAGMLGRWAFCFEESGIEGVKTRTLGRLSAETETIGFFTAGGKSSFIYLKDGQGVEAFEPGYPETLRGSEPRTFWPATQKIMERMAQTATIQTALMVPVHAVLQAVTKHVRGALDRSMLEGPLLTGYLSEAELAPMGAATEPPAAAQAQPVHPNHPTQPNHPARPGHPGVQAPTVQPMPRPAASVPQPSPAATPAGGWSPMVDRSSPTPPRGMAATRYAAS